MICSNLLQYTLKTKEIWILTKSHSVRLTFSLSFIATFHLYTECVVKWCDSLFQISYHIIMEPSNPFYLTTDCIMPHNHDFKQPCIRRLLKTLQEKEKMLVTSMFSFSHNVFFPIKDRNHHFSNNEFVVCKCFQFGPDQDFVL